MKKSIAILLFSLLSFASLFGQSREEDIIRLMEMTGPANTGKKLIQEMPAISRESMAAVQAWGMRIGQEIRQHLVEDGLLDI